MPCSVMLFSIPLFSVMLCSVPLFSEVLLSEVLLSEVLLSEVLLSETPFSAAQRGRAALGIVSGRLHDTLLICCHDECSDGPEIHKPLCIGDPVHRRSCLGALCISGTCISGT